MIFRYNLRKWFSRNYKVNTLSDNKATTRLDYKIDLTVSRNRSLDADVHETLTAFSTQFNNQRKPMKMFETSENFWQELLSAFWNRINLFSDLFHMSCRLNIWATLQHNFGITFSRTLLRGKAFFMKNPFQSLLKALKKFFLHFQTVIV